jgi:hypothetical protein
MQTILALMGSTLAGMVGWWLGDFVGTVTAFVLSTVASGFGYYYARRFTAGLLD